ncbi:MAG: ribosome maturation factor RimM [Hyphomicrobiales bacterium]|nr:ribosome maturation factor RimM [Hyphomicrobiales bacterium]
MAGDDRDRVCLGQVSSAHGIKGEVRIKPFTQHPEDVATYGPLQDEAGTRRFEILSLRTTKGGVVARLDGVTDRNQAEALKGVKLFVDRDRLPERTEEGVWYHADLIGLVALDTGGAAFGTIVAVQNYGAGDLLEIRPATGGPTVLLPFTAEVVPDVDPEAGWVLVDPPEGLID